MVYKYMYPRGFGSFFGTNKKQENIHTAINKSYKEQLDKIDKTLISVDKKLNILKAITPFNIESEKEKQQLDTGTWRIKHHAFFLNTLIQEHHYDFETLLEKEAKIQANITSGPSTQDPNIYSILFETMVQPVIPYKIK